MKHLKRIAAVLLALAMVLSMSTFTAFADNSEDNPIGSITINGIVNADDNTASEETVYEIYRLLDLESYDTEGQGAYSYKVNAAWTGFFATDEALSYVTIDKDGYVTWTAADDDAVVAEFAKKALAYAKANGISSVKSSENEGDFAVEGSVGVFANLELGYYLVDSTVGALCGLTTTNANAHINAKNGKPSIDKQVQEDSLTETETKGWGDSNTADIGQIVKFTTTISVHAGAENFVVHDIMSDGLTFQEVVGVQHIIPGGDTHDVPAGKYTVVTEGLEDDCTFEVVFSQEFCDELSTNDKIVISYTAMLNRNAVIAGEGNSNEAYLEYGEEHYTTHDKTKTYTYSIDLVKTDGQNKLIDGAEFRVYDAETGGNEVGFVYLMESDDKTFVLDENGNKMYRRAREDEMKDEKNISIVVKDGVVTLVGLDNGTYWLEETVAPDGYNKITTRQSFTIADANKSAAVAGGFLSTGSGVQVMNKTGTMLPETGGIGTTMFYIAGGVLVVAAVVLLITKRRMAK